MEYKNEVAKIFAIRIMKEMEEALQLVWPCSTYDEHKKFMLIKSLASLTSELLEVEEINNKMIEIAKSSKINGDNIEDKFNTFKMIRNVINHFPIFNTWDEIYISRDLLNWNSPKNRQIEKFFKEEKCMSYRIYLNEDDEWVEKKKIDIRVPCLGQYNKIYIKDVLSIDDAIWTFSAIDYYLQYLDLNITPRFIASL